VNRLVNQFRLAGLRLKNQNTFELTRVALRRVPGEQVQVQLDEIPWSMALQFFLCAQDTNALNESKP